MPQLVLHPYEHSCLRPLVVPCLSTACLGCQCPPAGRYRSSKTMMKMLKTALYRCPCHPLLLGVLDLLVLTILLDLVGQFDLLDLLFDHGFLGQFDLIGLVNLRFDLPGPLMTTCNFRHCCQACSSLRYIWTRKLLRQSSTPMRYLGEH